jgi:endonuclease YncB( thermonuclease family)
MDNEPILELDKNGTKRWWMNGKRHRVDGPAVEWADGDKWWMNGKRHRVDGPAVEWADGDKWWCLDGNVYTFDKWLEANKFISEEEKVMLKLIHG